MQTMTPQTDREIADYFNAQETAAINEMEILGTVVAEISRLASRLPTKRSSPGLFSDWSWKAT